MARRTRTPRRRTAASRWFIFAVIALVVVLYLVRRYQAPQPAPSSGVAPSAEPGTVRIASWNIRTLSNRKGDPELRKIAAIMSRFDLVAVQEPKDTQVLERLCALLPGWRYVASEAVGRGTSTEHYAFFWNASWVALVGKSCIVGDPDDLFIREPYAATFRARRFDFTLCTMHLLYGSSERERRQELLLMDEVVASVQNANGAEADVILLGDFNFPPDDEGWQLSGWTPAIRPPAKTTVGDRSLYDNIWFDPRVTTEYAGESGVVRFDVEDYGGDAERAKRELSDHRPIWAAFSSLADDDPDDYGNLSRAEVRRRARTASAFALGELLVAVGWHVPCTIQPR